MKMNSLGKKAKKYDLIVLLIFRKLDYNNMSKFESIFQEFKAFSL